MDFTNFLRSYDKNLTVEQVLKLEQEAQAKRLNEREEKEKIRQEFLESLVKKQYFKIVHNSESIAYIKIVNKDLKAETIEFYKDRIVTDYRAMNPLWFRGCPDATNRPLDHDSTQEEYDAIYAQFQAFKAMRMK